MVSISFQNIGSFLTSLGLVIFLLYYSILFPQIHKVNEKLIELNYEINVTEFEMTIMDSILDEAKSQRASIEKSMQLFSNEVSKLEDSLYSDGKPDTESLGEKMMISSERIERLRFFYDYPQYFYPYYESMKELNDLNKKMVEKNRENNLLFFKLLKDKDLMTYEQTSLDKLMKLKLIVNILGGLLVIIGLCLWFSTEKKVKI